MDKKVPSDEEIGQVLDEVKRNSLYGDHHWGLWLEFARALLARYVAQPGKTKLFAVNVLDRPMREHQPGKWETAVWPSECAQPAASAEPVGYFYQWELDSSKKVYPDGFPDAVPVFATPVAAQEQGGKDGS